MRDDDLHWFEKLRREEAENERKFFEEHPGLRPTPELVATLQSHGCPTATTGECYCPTPGDTSGSFQPCGHLERESCRNGCGACLECDGCYCGEGD